MEISLELLEVTQEPLIGRHTPGAENIRWGCEGGLVLEESGYVHVFTTECHAPPKISNTRLAHWRSPDGVTFERVSTLCEADSPAPDHLRSAMPWTPYPIFNDEEDRWNLFYVGYGSGSGSDTQIIRSVSEKPGREGLGGPYAPADCPIRGGADADPWEGTGSAVSFFPFKVRHGWLGFFGCNQVNTRNDVRFIPGLARSPSLSGPWTRLSHRNPVKMDDRFIENPIVYPVGDDHFVTFYDGETVHGIAYAYSHGGETWSREKVLWLESPPTPWAWWMRTPLGLIPREDGGHWLYYTAFDYADFDTNDPDEPRSRWYHRGFGTVGRIGIDIHLS